MTQFGELLDRLFVNAEAIIEELSVETGEFNSQQFVRKVMHDQQAAYIDILAYFRDNAEPFHRAHVEIGYHLSEVAKQQGFEQLAGSIPETSVFLTPTTATVYRRS
jgi:hypothetical protein